MCIIVPYLSAAPLSIQDEIGCEALPDLFDVEAQQAVVWRPPADMTIVARFLHLLQLFQDASLQLTHHLLEHDQIQTVAWTE